jgi:hypothetical protein
MLVCENPTLTGVESRRPNDSGEDAAAKVGVSGGASHASHAAASPVHSVPHTARTIAVILPPTTPWENDSSHKRRTSAASDGQIVRYIFSTARTSPGLMVLLPIVTGASIASNDVSRTV